MGLALVMEKGCDHLSPVCGLDDDLLVGADDVLTKRYAYEGIGALHGYSGASGVGPRVAKEFDYHRS